MAAAFRFLRKRPLALQALDPTSAWATTAASLNFGTATRLKLATSGCLLAAAALVLAIWCTPDARAWPASSEELGLAVQSGPVIMMLLALVMVLAFASVLQRAVGRLSAPHLISLALQAAALGTIGLLAAASLVCLSLVAVSLALWRRAIYRSICVVKEAAYAVWFLPQLLLCPIPTMAALLPIACCSAAATAGDCTGAASCTCAATAEAVARRCLCPGWRPPAAGRRL